jgi:hypothetical protein
MKYQLNALIPENKFGQPIDLSLSVILSTRNEALICFSLATKRLLNPPMWRQISGWTFDLLLISRFTKKEYGLAEEGDSFKFGTKRTIAVAGDEPDCLIVDNIKINANPSGPTEWLFFQMHPCRNSDTSQASHSYIIERNGNIVTARYHNRNETISVETGSRFESISNAKTPDLSVRPSKSEWLVLLKGLLSADVSVSR